MSSSRLVPTVACAVIALGVVLVTFVVVSGRNDPQPGSETPVGYEPPPEFVEEVRQRVEAEIARAAAAAQAAQASDSPSAEGPKTAEGAEGATTTDGTEPSSTTPAEGNNADEAAAPSEA